MRVWLRQYDHKIVLAPLISWVAPAHRGDALFLRPSLLYCQQRLDWSPDIVVGDMAYINLERQRQIRERMKIAVITKLRADMTLPDEFDPGPMMTCEHGQRLDWLGLEHRDQLHWFGVQEEDPLCSSCWQYSSCPRQFSFPPAQHEILYGTIPLSSSVAQSLLSRARPWIEAAQSYEKNQLGLSQMFLNSLRLSWTTCLLADTVALLRARAIITQPPHLPLLHKLIPKQFSLDLRD